MNSQLGKSNCHSSFPLFLPSLLHYRRMTGQSCRRSCCCFPSICHQSITSHSLSCLHPTNFSCPLMSLFISIYLVTPRVSRLLAVSVACRLCNCTFLLNWWPHLSGFFSLSTLLIPLFSSLQYRQSDGFSSVVHLSLTPSV